MKCGKCGCSIVGELKKKRYTYYHCTDGRRECDRKYIREEVLEGQFADLVGRIVIDAETAEWIKEALRESLEEETAFHRQELERLTRGIEKVKSRLNQAYLDKVGVAALSWPGEDPKARACLQCGDHEAIAWSYAAALAAGVEPYAVFENGFQEEEARESAWLGCKMGQYMGIHGLRAGGYFASVKDYPKMEQWLAP